MKQQTQQALDACFVAAGGLICGWVTFFYRPADCTASGAVQGLALFISDVLLNAFLAGIASGLVLSFLVFPLEYFLIKRFNRTVGIVIFIFGFLIGSVVPRIAAALS